jgi:hypothetical protein
MRASEFITEVPQGVMNILRQELPGWPDYVIKDMVYSKIRNPNDLDEKLEHVRHLAQEAGSWRLVQKMPLTFDMLDPDTQRRMKERKFGDANPFKVPNDRERFEHALELVKTKGMENLPPVIFKQTADGLELWEGWHRTLAAFRLHPKMFRVNAWIAQPATLKEGVRQKLDFDEIYGRYLKVTDNDGDPNKEGFSLVTPLNGASWNWRERPEFKELVKRQLNQPGWLGDYKYQQIIDAMAGNKFDPVKHLATENFADGKKPGRKGLSRRVGIPKKASLSQLQKIASSSTGERRRMAQWQLNMRRGKAKKSGKQK